jgi:hypothetical protein
VDAGKIVEHWTSATDFGDMVILFALSRSPVMKMFVTLFGLGDSRLSEVSVTPGNRPTTSMKSRPRSAMSFMSSPVTTPPR